MAYINFLNTIITGSEPSNSAAEMIWRESGFHIDKDLSIVSGGAGAVTVDVLEFTGSVIIINQWAEIQTITDITTLSNAYATIYDGTNTVNLTADGLDLSGATVGSFFTKDKVATEAYSFNDADECRLLETLSDRKAGRPFTITAKNGATNTIQLNATLDVNTSVVIKIHFEYIPINGGTLVFL